MSNVQSYNALIDRFKAFASGHFILKTFSHGQIETADLEKFTEYPFMHVVPSNVTYAKGTKTFSFQIVLADLPRDKDDKVEFQREVLSDLQRIAEDLIAEITNHRVLFGDLITVQNVTLEPFLEEFHNTLTGWTVSLDLLVPYYWDACSIPAEWNDFFESSTGGTGSILTFIDSIVRDENGNVSLVNDEATPAPNYYYGTNDEGVRGWYLLTDEVGLTCATIGTCQTIIDIESAIDALQIQVGALETDVALKANTADISAVGFSNDYDDLDNKPTIPTATSDLTNDGEDGINPFITAADVPVQVNSDWNATSGVAEILNKPTIPAAQIQSDWTQSNNAALDYIKNKPTIPAGGLPAGGTTGQILTKVDATDYNATWQENFADWTSVVKHTVKNNGLSGTITKGTAVYVTGSNGTNMLVGRASNTSEATSSKTMGLMQSDITTTGTNQTGFVITEGLLEGLNTAGQTAGDPVWLGVNGALIYGLANKPYAPAHLVFIGIVTKVSAGNGEIFVKVQNGFELKEIHDVDIITTTPINGHVLGFDGTLWVNKTVAGWLGFTPVTDARTISTTAPLSGGGDLTANRTLSIAQATTSVSGYLSSTDWSTFNGKFTLPSLTSGSVLFSNGTTIAQNNANFFWDNTNSRLGIGTATPENQFQVRGGTVTTYAQVTSGVGIQSNSSGSGLITALNLTPADPSAGISNGANFGFNGSANNFFGIGLGAVRTSKYDIWFQTGSQNGGGYRWYIGTTERMTLFQNGNFAIGTTTDAGYKLDVNGTARLNGLTAINGAGIANTALAVYGNGNGAGNYLFQMFDASSVQRFFLTASGNFKMSSATDTGTSGDDEKFRLALAFTPTSGTRNHYGLYITQTINQTGGANGITRGLYIQPTLTAAADFRAIETTRGRIVFGNLPTSSAGLPTGAIWNDAGTLKIV